MCNKNDNPNLTQNFWGSIKGRVVNLYLISLVVSIHGRPQAPIAAFSGHLPAMLLFLYSSSCFGTLHSLFFELFRDYAFLIRLTPCSRLFFTISGLICEYLTVSDEIERKD